MPMALVQLGQLQKAMERDKESYADGPRGRTPALIFGEEGTRLQGACFGPDMCGACPLSGSEAVGCAGAWVAQSGWMFRVADDAAGCPLVSLGLVPERREIPEAAGA
jgi:hypothetical protein